jgi:hypothetical protein
MEREQVIAVVAALTGIAAYIFVSGFYDIWRAEQDFERLVATLEADAVHGGIDRRTEGDRRIYVFRLPGNKQVAMSPIDGWWANRCRVRFSRVEGASTDDLPEGGWFPIDECRELVREAVGADESESE